MGGARNLKSHANNQLGIIKFEIILLDTKVQMDLKTTLGYVYLVRWSSPIWYTPTGENAIMP